MTEFKRWFGLAKWSKLSKLQKSAAVVVVLVILAVATSAASSTGSNIPGASSSKPSTPSSVATKTSDGQATKSNQVTKSSSSSGSGQSQSAQPQVTQAQAQQPTPRYYLVSTYGNGGRTYVIDSADATESQLTLIGKDLNKLFGSDDMARIGIYTDPSQAQIGADPAQASALQGDAATTYKNSYVAQFNVNKSTNTKQFFVYLNGSTKEIKL